MSIDLGKIQFFTKEVYNGNILELSKDEIEREFYSRAKDLKVKKKEIRCKGIRTTDSKEYEILIKFKKDKVYSIDLSVNENDSMYGKIILDDLRKLTQMRIFEDSYLERRGITIESEIYEGLDDDEYKIMLYLLDESTRFTISKWKIFG